MIPIILAPSLLMELYKIFPFITALLSKYKTRPPISKKRRLNIAERQNNACINPNGICLCPNGILPMTFQIDHKSPFRVDFNDDDSNLQALCVECHAYKTMKDRELYPY